MAENNLINGRFERLENIGEGAMGAVYKGRDTQTDELVAIKVLKPDVIKQDPQIIERFEREGEALRRLNHPSIVKVLATVEDDNDHYLILEYVEGGSLRGLMTETPRMPIPQILEIALDLSDALARAHRLDIVHRDIKPENVLVATDGTPRLTDFGIARIGDTSQMTQTGVIMGTMAYLPPEALSGQRTDFRGDIWAFGVMLYEMCTGRRPFIGDNTGAILNGILNQEPPDMLKFREYEEFGSWGLPGLIYWMLEKDREKRPQSARLIGAMVENLMSGKELPSYNWFGDTSGQYDTPTRPPMNPKEIASAAREYTTSGFTLSELNAQLAEADVGNKPHKSATVGLDSQWKADPTISKSDWSIQIKRIIDHKPRIFISYRRSDSTAMTGRITDRLVNSFGSENVFRDTENIPVGADFKEVIHSQIMASDVVLVMIGKTWLNAADENGRRLENPDDVVRFEVETALNKDNALVIPVLLDETPMPEQRLLPPKMQPLTYHNAAPIRHDPDFNRDAEFLINQIFNAFEVEFGDRKLSWQGIATISGFVLALILSVALIWVLATGGASLPTATNAMPETCNVDPVAEDEFMILVAQTERITGDERDVQRFIVDDLTEHFEHAVPNSRYRIRAAETVIASDETARQLADLCDSLVIIWGNYDDQQIEMNVQVGDFTAYPSASVFEEGEFRVLTDVRYQMTNERQETLAFGVVATLNGMWTATNNPYNVAETLTIADIVPNPPANIMGNTAGARYHQAVLSYIDDPEASVAVLTDAIRTNGAIPLLYMTRSLSYLRVGQLTDAEDDARTAGTIVTAPWIMPDFMQSNIMIYGYGDLEGAIPSLDAVLQIISDDWFINAVRATIAYIAFDYDTAQIHTDRSLANNPQASFPYATAVALALRDGRFVESQQLLEIVQTEFPDATFGERIISVALSEQATQSVFVPFFAGFGNLAIQRWNGVIEATDTAIEMNINHPDIYFLRGFAQCNLGDYPAAEASYTQAIELDPEYYMLYLLRAEVRLKQGLSRTADVLDDMGTIIASPQAEIYQPFTILGPRLVEEISCETLFDLDLSEFGFTE